MTNAVLRSLYTYFFIFPSFVQSSIPSVMLMQPYTEQNYIDLIWKPNQTKK